MRFIVCVCVCALLPVWRQTYAPPKGSNGLTSVRRELLPVFGKGPVKGLRARQGPGNIPARVPAFNVGPERSLAKGVVQKGKGSRPVHRAPPFLTVASHSACRLANRASRLARSAEPFSAQTIFSKTAKARL